MTNIAASLLAKIAAITKMTDRTDRTAGWLALGKNDTVYYQSPSYKGNFILE